MIELRAERAPSAKVERVLKDCASRDADYRSDKNFADVKPSLRIELWREQGALCVYCERKLPSEDEIARHGDLAEERKTRIEHIRPRAGYPELRFEYQNLALSCAHPKSCDQKKGNKELRNAPGLGVNACFALKNDGKLEPVGSKHEKKARRRDINDVLGLNSHSLIQARRQTVNLLKNALNNQQIEEEDVSVFIERSEFRHTLDQWWDGDELSNERGA